MLGLGNCIPSSTIVESYFSTKSLFLDGSNDYVDIGAGLDLGTADFSVSFWFKASEVTSSFFIQQYEDANDFWYIGVSADDKPTFYSKNGGTNTMTLTSSTAVSENAWHHVVVTCDRSDGSTGLKVYVDGDPDGSSAASTTTLTNSGDVQFGLYTTNLFSESKFLDEVAMWDTVLSSTAVTALYNDGVPTNLSVTDGDYAAQGDLLGWWRMGDGIYDDLDQGASQTTHGNGFITDQNNPGFGSDMFDSGKGTFDSGTTGWSGWSNNTIANVDNQLEVTYVDNILGVKALLNVSGPLDDNLTIGKVYMLQFDAKYTGGSSGVHARITTGEHVPATSDFTTTMETYKLYFKASLSTGNVFHLHDMAADNVVTIDNVSIREANGYPGMVIGQVASFSGDFSNEFN